MKQLIRAIIGGLTAFVFGCGGTSSACNNELSREQIQGIVDAETVKRFGSVPQASKKQVTIDRDGCDYVYFEQQVPPVPGGHLEVRIDEHGQVIEYVPGL